jgi:hypothetical protein
MILSEETIKFIVEHSCDDVRTLALQASRFPGVDMLVAISQIAGRQRAKEKLPSWFCVPDIWYPLHLPLEQCSSETTARYKAGLVSGGTLVDLTGGLGVDCSFLSHRFMHTVYVERQTGLCELAAHNFGVLGLSSIEIVQGDSETYLKSINSADVIFIDPARRNGQGCKVFAIADCEPNLLKIKEMLFDKGNKVLVKLSPMLDLYASVQQLKCVAEVHVVSVANECKELLLMLDKRKIGEPTIHCVNIVDSGVQSYIFTRTEEEISNCMWANSVNNYLYEPNASLLKAGAFRNLAVRFGLSKFHTNTHLYTSDQLLFEFPGRIFQVTGYSSFNKKELRNLLQGIEKANITVRNFPISSVDLHKRLHLGDGGDVYLFVTTIANGQHLIIRCKKVALLK